jgi:bacillithiol biosynthesis cysteine-adding enzyme BshC
LDSECLRFADIPGTSHLFLDFLSHAPEAQNFYPTSTASLDELARQAARIQLPPERRERVATVLARQNRSWNAGPETLASIEKLRAGACAVVSGQQLGLFLGPAFTVYKAVTAIRLARELNARGVEAVPVFWLASEDHDLAEVNHVFVPDSNYELRRLETSSRGKEAAPVGTVVLDSDLTSLTAQLQELIGDSETLNLIRESYCPGQTFSGAFAELMTRLFSRHGLILLESSDPELHQIAAPLFQSAAEKAEALNSALLERNRELESAGYHAQVNVTGSSTLLFFIKDGSRIPILRKNGNFTVNGEHWTAQELAARVSSNPELFSAKVLLRPVFQDYLLPTVTYIAGPAETAYFAQVQVVYDQLLERTTPVWPRFSATLIEARLGSWMRKLGLQLRDVLQPRESFVAALARRIIPADIKEDFDRTREHLDRLLGSLIQSLKQLDPTIAEAGESAANKMRYQLEHLESRAAKAHLQRTEVVERKANLMTTMLFPEKELQERRIGGIYFLGKYAPDLIDRLLEQYRPECRDHQIIYLD